MMLKTLYLYELKKLFFSKVNLLALAGTVIMIVVLIISSNSEVAPVSREAAKELDGRVIDGQIIEEVRPALRYENGATVFEITGEYEKYVPAVDIITSVAGYDSDITQLQGDELYDLREQKQKQLMEKQGLTETEKEFWSRKEEQVQKPFVYHYHSGPANLLKSFQALGFFILLLSAIGLSGVYARETADNMNQLLLCSRYGRKELFVVKFTAGITWILAVALIIILSLLIPIYITYGMEGMGEMVQLVKPLSMLPLTIGRMLAIYMGIFLLAAVLFASVTMLLSVITQNALAVTCALMGYLLIDLFADFPDRLRLLQKIWTLRPNAVLMNTGFSNFRLFHLAGKFFLNYQAAPVFYVIIVFVAFLFGKRKYKMLQSGN